jgi:ubiquinone biosynthesis protein COQ9
MAILAQPQNLSLAARLSWRAVDRIWRVAGDTAADFNHYTKRATLLGVYSSTVLTWLDDDSPEYAETRAFLDRRIEDVMRIEKLKAEWRKGRERLPSLSRFLGRLRYPAI